ncbi:MAG TPA: glycosyltransferase family 1 protein [Usitatibacteraceae bacterium]
MKLVLSIEALGPQLSGIGRYTWELASRLPTNAGVESIRFYRNKRWVQELAPLLSGDKLQVRPWPEVVAGWMRPLSIRRGEIFHGPNYFLPTFVEHGVATIHDLSVFRYPETHPAKRLAHFEKEFSQSLKRAAHLITDTEAVRQEVIEFCHWPADKITAVPLGVSPAFAPRTPESITAVLSMHGLSPGAYSLCVSTIEPRKKIDCLLAVYASLSENIRRRYPLVLIGGQGWLSDALHDEIDKAREQGWLHYLGFVSEPEMVAIYAGARAFVFPSIYEGFGLPVIEAMASGVPVVTSNRSCLPEVSQGAALLVDPDEVDALRTAIQKCLEDDPWRADAIEAGLHVAAGLTWDRCVQKTVDVYAKMRAT